MPQIIVEREEGSLADRFRPYTVIIDGKIRGTIRHSEKCAFAVPGGIHSVSFQAGDYYSPPLKVAVITKTRLVCWSNMAHAFGLMAWVDPASWITVREEDDCVAGSVPLVALSDEDGSDDAYELRRSRLWRGGNVRLRAQPESQRSANN